MNRQSLGAFLDCVGLWFGHLEPGVRDLAAPVVARGDAFVSGSEDNGWLTGERALVSVGTRPPSLGPRWACWRWAPAVPGGPALCDVVRPT